MRLTAELINTSLSYLNPLKERELDLRGHRIPAIENLGVAKDHDALDLTDNDIPTLSNFPLSPRLHTLLLSRNRIASIQPTLAKSIPNLTTLVLSSNRLAELADLDPLAGFGRLTHLILQENPVQKKEYYREYVCWRCPGVRSLDYRKVKDSERERGTELFGTAEAPTALAQKISNIKSRTFDPSSTTTISATTNNTSTSDKIGRAKFSEKEREAIARRIAKAKSLKEIDALERELNEGRIPKEVLDEMDMS